MAVLVRLVYRSLAALLSWLALPAGMASRAGCAAPGWAEAMW